MTGQIREVNYGLGGGQLKGWPVGFGAGQTHAHGWGDAAEESGSRVQRAIAVDL